MESAINRDLDRACLQSGGEEGLLEERDYLVKPQRISANTDLGHKGRPSQNSEFIQLNCRGRWFPPGTPVFLHQKTDFIIIISPP